MNARRLFGVRLVAACICLPFGHSHAQQAPRELGSLFNTPEERAAIDRKRLGVPDAVPAATRPRVERKPLVTGFVRREGGGQTVFLDGRPTYAPADRVVPTRPSDVVGVYSGRAPRVETSRTAR